MPNPSGQNQFMREPGYGQIKRLDENTKAAPMSGAPVAAGAVNAPRRARRAAESGRTAGTASVSPSPETSGPFGSAEPEGPSYEEQVAEAWAELAADPSAGPIIKEYAAEAARLAGLGD